LARRRLGRRCVDEEGDRDGGGEGDDGAPHDRDDVAVRGAGDAAGRGVAWRGVWER
jgi:hypothetical protein